MSDALYFTRLHWGQGRGVAKMQGRSVPLYEPPAIAGLAIEELIYTPEVHVAVVQEVGKAKRELLPHEIAACAAFLRRTVWRGET